MVRLAGVVLACAVGGSAFGQVGYTNESFYEPGFLPCDSVFGGDLDGDGDMDLVPAITNETTLRWLENNGSTGTPSFTPVDYGTAAFSISDVFVCDVDGDGDNDIVAIDSLGDSVRWFDNDGSAEPSFTARDIDLSIQSPNFVVAGDMNGDGHVDIVVSADIGSGGDAISWYENDGAAIPSFTKRALFVGTQPGRNLALADMDGDGDLDVVSTSILAQALYWHENDGAAVPSFAATVIGAMLQTPRDVFTADINGDGAIDIVLAERDNDSLNVYYNSGASDPIFPSGPVLFASSPLAVWAADIDADGDTDIVFSRGGGTGRVLYYENLGGTSPSFMVQGTVVGGSNLLDFFVADINADGDADIIAADFNSVEPAVQGFLSDQSVTQARIVETGVDYFSIGLAVFAALPGQTVLVSASFIESETALTFLDGVRVQSEVGIDIGVDESVHGADEAEIATTPRQSQQIGAADVPLIDSTDALTLGGDFLLESGEIMDADVDAIEVLASGGIEIGAFGGLFADRLTRMDAAGDVMLERGATLTVASDVSMTSERSWVTRLISGTKTSAEFVEVGDYDGDGDLDGMGVSASEGIRLYEYVPAGTLVSVVGPFVGADLTAAVFGDVDGDGDLDIVSIDSGDDTVRWHENTGGAPSGWPSVLISTTANGASQVQVGDMDDDGDLDIVVSAKFDFLLYWYENDGNATPGFTENVLQFSVTQAEGVFISDLDDDGDLDVISTAQTIDTVYWHENNGAANPSFTRRTIFGSADSPLAVFAVDLDGDDDIDVLSASRDDDTVRWYENNGAVNPTFVVRTVGSVDGAYDVVAGDVDQDGDIDVVAAGLNDDTVWVFENDGGVNPVFTRREIFSGADGASGVAIGDFDQDGDGDVLSCSLFDDSVRWHENLSGASTSIGDLARMVSMGSIANSRVLTIGSGAAVSADLGIQNDGAMRLGFGTLLGDVSNLVGGTLSVDGSGQVVGSLTNDGLVSVDGVLSVSGAVVDNGVIDGSVTSLGGLLLESGYTAGSGAEVRLGVGAFLSSGGSLDIAIDSNTRFDLASAVVTLDGVGLAFELMSLDIGPDPAGLDRTIAGHYPLGTLRIASGSDVDLVDVHDNAGDGQGVCEALYVSSLVIESGAMLDTLGCRVYYGSLTLDGAVDDAGNLVPIDFACNPADLNDAGAPSPAFPNFGVSDGILTPTDFSAFTFYFSTGDLRADINTASAPSPAFPGFGVPDGILTPTDFSAFAAYFGAGCPCGLPGCP